jgi:hypothetical protein
MATAAERPRARTEGLVVKALPDEVLVHDLARHRTHCLNGHAAAVWRLCDGRRTPADIARTLTQTPDGRWSDEAVRLALDELGRAHLLTDVLTGRHDASGVTRRQTLQRLAAAAVVVPTVATIVAPRAAQAQSQSCASLGQSCITFPTPPFQNCCPGLACSGPPLTCRINPP